MEAMTPPRTPMSQVALIACDDVDVSALNIIFQTCVQNLLHAQPTRMEIRSVSFWQDMGMPFSELAAPQMMGMDWACTAVSMQTDLSSARVNLILPRLVSVSSSLLNQVAPQDASCIANPCLPASEDNMAVVTTRC